MESFHFHLHHSLAETHGFCHIVLREVYLLAVLKTDEVQLEWTFLFGKREDKGLLPRHIFGLGGRLTIALLVVIGQSTVS